MSESRGFALFEQQLDRRDRGAKLTPGRLRYSRGGDAVSLVPKNEAWGAAPARIDGIVVDPGVSRATDLLIVPQKGGLEWSYLLTGPEAKQSWSYRVELSPHLEIDTRAQDTLIVDRETGAARFRIQTVVAQDADGRVFVGAQNYDHRTQTLSFAVKLDESAKFPVLVDPLIASESGQAGLISSLAPPARAYAALAFDPVRNVVVLFGGEDGESERNDTWEWDLNTQAWTQRFPATVPGARSGHAMGYHTLAGRVVMAGGRYDLPTFNDRFFHRELSDVWTWDGTDWTEVIPEGSHSAFSDRRTVYVADTDVLAFVGEGAAYGLTSSGGTYTMSAFTMPPGARHAELGAAYDPTSTGVVYFGGRTGEREGGGGATELYVDGALIDPGEGISPPVRQDSQLFYDPEEAAFFALVGFRLWAPAEFWRLSPGTWSWERASNLQLPSPRKGAAGVLVGDRGYLYFGGYDRTNACSGGYALMCNDTWWRPHGGDWTLINAVRWPGPRSQAAAIALPEENAIVLYGGLSRRTDADPDWNLSPSVLGDTWVFHTETRHFTQIHSPTMPRARHSTALAKIESAATTQLLMYGGVGSLVDSIYQNQAVLQDREQLDDTWRFDFDAAAWTAVPSDGPGEILGEENGRSGHAMAGMGSLVVMQGGTDRHNDLQDTWLWDAETELWTRSPANFSPGPQRDHRIFLDPENEQLLLVGREQVWRYVDGDWFFATDFPETDGKPTLDTAGTLAYAFQGQLSTLRLADGEYTTEDFGAQGPSERRATTLLHENGLSDRLWLFGGAIGNAYTNDLWFLEGGIWTELRTTGPSNLEGPAMAYAATTPDLGTPAVLVLGDPYVSSRDAPPDAWAWGADNASSGSFRILADADGVSVGLAGMSRPVFETVSDILVGYESRHRSLCADTSAHCGVLAKLDLGVDAPTWAVEETDASAPLPRFGAATTTSPLPLAGPDRLWLFGGSDAGRVCPGSGGIPECDDFWTLHTVSVGDHSWDRVLATGDRPQSRVLSAMAYYETPGAEPRILLFGGVSDKSALDPDVKNDLWIFTPDEERTGGTWALVEPADDAAWPSPRYGHQIAFDDESGTALLFGGRDNNGPVPDSHWTYDVDAQTWSPPAPDRGSLPPGRSRHGMAYVPADNGSYALVYGGATTTNPRLEDMWRYDFLTESWRNPAVPFVASASGDGELWFSGEVTVGAQVDGLWAQTDSGAWEPERVLSDARPPTRTHAAFVRVAANQRILVGGFTNDGGGDPDSFTDESWLYASGSWTELEAEGIEAAGMAAAYHEGEGYAIAFGGNDDDNLSVIAPDFNDDATFLDTTWRLTPAGAVAEDHVDKPGRRAFGAMAYDPAGDRLVLFGGVRETVEPLAGHYDDTWIYTAADGWSELDTDTAPPARYGHRMVYLPAWQSVAIVGGIGAEWLEPPIHPDGTYALNDIWILLNDNWVQVENEATRPHRSSFPLVGARGAILVVAGGYHETRHEVTEELWSGGLVIQEVECTVEGDCPAPTECQGVLLECSDDNECVYGALAAGTICRPAAGPCDVEEACDGTSDACPSNAVVDRWQACRPAADDCDQVERCDGSSVLCPEDRLHRAGSWCRSASGPCDVSESCDGISAACPADDGSRRAAGILCRHALSNECDVPDYCDGQTADCANGYRPEGTVCRAATGLCDLEEVCDGLTAQCPEADLKSPEGATCRASAGPCDAVETCDGVLGACGEDAFVDGVVCREAVDLCDEREVCTGLIAACPEDAKKGQGTICDPALNVCESSARCTGDDDICPPKAPGAEDGAACDDLDGCTETDVCASGQCRGSPVVCDSGALCALEACIQGACLEVGRISDCCESDDDCRPRFERCDVERNLCVGRPCSVCDNDDACGGDADLCVSFYNGAFCTDACPEEGACPEGYLCEPVTREGQTFQQCLPEAGTCVCTSPPIPACDADGNAITEDRCGHQLEAIEDCGGRGCVAGNCCTAGDTLVGAACAQVAQTIAEGQGCNHSGSPEEGAGLRWALALVALWVARRRRSSVVL